MSTRAVYLQIVLVLVLVGAFFWLLSRSGGVAQLEEQLANTQDSVKVLIPRLDSAKRVVRTMQSQLVADAARKDELFATIDSLTKLKPVQIVRKTVLIDTGDTLSLQQSLATVTMERDAAETQVRMLTVTLEQVRVAAHELHRADVAAALKQNERLEQLEAQLDTAKSTATSTVKVASRSRLRRIYDRTVNVGTKVVLAVGAFELGRRWPN
jgi:hypothetical protein